MSVEFAKNEAENVFGSPASDGKAVAEAQDVGASTKACNDQNHIPHGKSRVHLQ
jgi:hypothetical protein